MSDDDDLTVEASIGSRRVPVLCAALWTGPTITAVFGELDLGPAEAAGVLALLREAYLASRQPEATAADVRLFDDTYQEIVEAEEETFFPLDLTGPLPEA